MKMAKQRLSETIDRNSAYTQWLPHVIALSELIQIQSEYLSRIIQLEYQDRQFNFSSKAHTN